MLAGEARVAFEAFAEAVLAAEALLVAAVGALGPREGEEDQIAHLYGSRGGGVPVGRPGLRGCPPSRLPSGCDGPAGSAAAHSPRAVGADGTLSERWRREGRATNPLPPFALDQRLSLPSVLQGASAVH